MFSLQKKVVKRQNGIRTLILFILGLSFLPCFAQENRFDTIAEKDILHMVCGRATDAVLIEFYHVPDDLEGAILSIYNSKGKNIGRIQISYDNHESNALELSAELYKPDTLILTIDHSYQAKYPPEMLIIYQGAFKHVWMGKNCVKLRCEPYTEPYMPSNAKPFYFAWDKYYVNPKTGKSILGKKALRRYDSCALENFKVIFLSSNSTPAHRKRRK